MPAPGLAPVAHLGADVVAPMEYSRVMPNPDLLVVAGLAAEVLERHGLVACGRREDGVTHVDFWSRDGKAYRHTVEASASSVDEVVAACLVLAGIAPAGAAS